MEGEPPTAKAPCSEGELFAPRLTTLLHLGQRTVMAREGDFALSICKRVEQLGQTTIIILFTRLTPTLNQNSNGYPWGLRQPHVE